MAGSAWISRIVIALVQLASVRILISELGLDQYAVFALLTGLTGWYVLSDFGVGISVQNYISESRAKGGSDAEYMAIAGILAIFFLLLTSGFVYVISPYAGPFFLRQFGFMSDQEKTKLFFSVGLLLVAGGVGGVAYKIWYAEQKGYWSNIVPALASVIGFAGIVLIKDYITANRLYLSLVVFILPTAILPLIALAYQVTGSVKKASKLNRSSFIHVLRRAMHFWGFAVMAAGVLQIDYVVMSQFLKAYDIAVYNISTKIFGFAFYFYGAVLGALWPVFAEELANRKWQAVRLDMQKYLAWGLGFMALSTVMLLWLMPVAVHLLAPTKQLVVPFMFTLLLGSYYMVRIWTDTFAMVLQSMSDLKPFWIYVPVQMILSIVLQWMLTPIWGIYGIVLGLLGSFLFTVSWALPWAVRQHHRLSEGH